MQVQAQHRETATVAVRARLRHTQLPLFLRLAQSDVVTLLTDPTKFQTSAAHIWLGAERLRQTVTAAAADLTAL